jgi:hypothetical protein
MDINLLGGYWGGSSGMGVQGFMTPECAIPSSVGYYCKAGNSRGLRIDSIVAESAIAKTNSVI